MLTLRVAVAALPSPPSEEVIALVVLTLEPTVVPVTVILKLHEVFAASDPPEKEIVLGAVVVREPPQAEVGPEVTTVRPAGKVSVNPIPLSETD